MIVERMSYLACDFMVVFGLLCTFFLASQQGNYGNCCLFLLLLIF